MKKTRCLMIGVIALFFFSSAMAGADNKKDNPDDIGNRKVAHRSIISEEKEIAIGKQYSEQIDKTAKLITDPVVTEYINRIGQNLARNSDLKIPLTVKVIDAPGINAFALPGGFLYVNTGLVLMSDEEAQIAGVMGHEIAHVAARHWASQMTKQTIAQYAMIPLIFTPMTYGVYYGIMEAYMNGVPLMFLKFSRADEAEADFLGLQYMYKAGYDPKTYLTIWAKVENEERASPGSVPKVFMDHPPTPDRVIKLDEEMNTFPARPEYLVSTSEFDDVKARLQDIISNRRKNNKQEGPTLRKREQTEETKTPTTQPSNSSDDKPPVLKRKDSGTGPNNNNY